jgi:capsular exopolysaccharide synthesis family protein
VFPNFKVNTALGLFFGFLGSIGFIVIRDQTDRTLRHPGEMKQWASLPELGTIPRLQCTVNQKTALLLPKNVGKPKFPNGGSSPKSSGQYNLLNLADVCNWPIRVPEAFHSTLTSILLAGENRGSGRVLVFTSAGPADGKTSVVSNIAIAAAAAGKKVLLVDADLRRPRIHDIFGLKNDAGLAELLRSGADCTRWPEIAQHTKMAGLTVITAGKPGRGAGILFYSPDFPTLLAKWREQYDLVLLDTPPALPITDARVIGILADGVVLVTRAGQTTREALLAIQERFAEDRIHLLGCILNDWDPSRSGRAYQYYVSEEEIVA